MLLIGLGNPGKQYQFTRHNIGFIALDIIAELTGASWGKSNKFAGEFASCSISVNHREEKLYLLKPHTYMNLSGLSANSVKNFYKIDIDDILVFHDDIDLKLGEIRCKKGGGSAGHNGLKSLDEKIGQNYHRIRIGIGRPSEKYLVPNFVLENFTSSEEEIINTSLKFIEKSFLDLIAKNFKDIVFTSTTT
ncbi:MAG: aminoacyl-tRNA hydrolase [Rickettsiaceae bacterium]|nr:aminoacyl-tRNA hydrolase [Rickettsiaceae bacterium]